MNNRIKDTVNVQVGTMSIYCYILEDGSRFIGERIKMYFKGNPNVTLVPLLDDNNNEIKTYSFIDVIEHLNLNTLQIFAQFGLNGLIDTTLSNPPKEKKLGDFDKLIKKALEYNPKDREK
ncbi:hypothetical protein CLV62_1303 [Dysgonomonas alginatilytica]|uniref:Uncharacterized protein n=1 Tax=Dysgonomonas alginatilytica TaxID=1605892 RepID=A0A2V3PRB2_9BACT|nr:hypothetical protein [Dysgonomonas alginatilytica]PXV60155.1 hypothetical protein CLV62_1303 [Dysgonomonas alginatilytica]